MQTHFLAPQTRQPSLPRRKLEKAGGAVREDADLLRHPATPDGAAPGGDGLGMGTGLLGGGEGGWDGGMGGRGEWDGMGGGWGVRRSVGFRLVFVR